MFNKLPKTTLRDRFRGCFIGLAVGDAVGATKEFESRTSCIANPVTGMVGGGPWRLRPGDWTDDTSMAFGLGASLLERRTFDPVDILDRWAEWMHGRAYCGTHGRGCVDIGGTTSRELWRFCRTGMQFADPTDHSEANGCVMRFAPLALFAYPLPLNVRRDLARTSSAMTHANPVCVSATEFLGDLLHGMLAQERAPGDTIDRWHPKLAARLVQCNFSDPAGKAIRSSGHVIDTMEASMWATSTLDGFKPAILRAVNLGGDADTVGAVTGQIAGAMYGYSGIPEDWRKIDRHDELLAIADGLYDLAMVEESLAGEAVPDPADAYVELGEAGA